MCIDFLCRENCGCAALSTLEGKHRAEAEHNNQVDEIFRREANREQSTAGVKEGRAPPPPPPHRSRGGCRNTERGTDDAGSQPKEKQDL